jgi:hypothetical protein
MYTTSAECGKQITSFPPETYLKHHHKGQSGSQNVPIHRRSFVFVGHIWWFPVVSIPESHKSHHISRDYIYTFSDLTENGKLSIITKVLK